MTTGDMNSDDRLDPRLASYLDDGDLPEASDLDDAGSDRGSDGGSNGVSNGVSAARAVMRLLGGDLRGAEETARAVTIGHVTPASTVARGVLAAVSTWRGDLVEIDGTGDRWSSAIAHVLVADATATVAPALAVSMSETAVGLAERAGDEGLLRWADRCRVNATLTAGDHRSADTMAERLSDSTRGDAAANDRLRGTIALRLDDRGRAAALLTQAVDGLATAGRRLELVPTVVALSEADHENAPDHLAHAREVIEAVGPDAAFDRMLAARTTLEVTMLGEQSLSVAGEPVRGKTTHADKLVFSLVLAGRHGLDARELCTRLWPDKDLEKAMNSLTTATWEARAALGPEAWRLGRVGDHLTLDADLARIDLDDAVLALDAGDPDPAVLERLRRPLLPAWRFEDWVIEADERRAAVASRY